MRFLNRPVFLFLPHLPQTPWARFAQPEVAEVESVVVWVLAKEALRVREVAEAVEAQLGVVAAQGQARLPAGQVQMVD